MIFLTALVTFIYFQPNLSFGEFAVDDTNSCLITSEPIKTLVYRECVDDLICNEPIFVEIDVYDDELTDKPIDFLSFEEAIRFADWLDLDVPTYEEFTTLILKNSDHVQIPENLWFWVKRESFGVFRPAIVACDRDEEGKYSFKCFTVLHAHSYAGVIFVKRSNRKEGGMED